MVCNFIIAGDWLKHRFEPLSPHDLRTENTKLELILFTLLDQKGYRFKKHFKILGLPDIVFPKNRVVIFVDGEFWRNKIGKNIRRDRKINRALRSGGWHVMRLWDKRILNSPEESFLRLEKFLKKNS